MTGQRNQREELWRSEERFRLLVESVKDYAIFMLDPEGIVTSWSEGAERIKGYREEEVLGRHFSIFYGPDAVAEGHPQRVLEQAAREGRYEEEGWRYRKDGSRFWADVVLTALRSSTGELLGFAKVTRDLTDRLAAQEALADARAELARRTISQQHALEINDNIVQGLVLAKYALDRGDVEANERALTSTLGEARRIVSELLSHAELESGRFRRERPPPVASSGEAGAEE